MTSKDEKIKTYLMDLYRQITREAAWVTRREAVHGYATVYAFRHRRLKLSEIADTRRAEAKAAAGAGAASTGADAPSAGGSSGALNWALTLD